MVKLATRVEVKYDDGIWYPGTIMSPRELPSRIFR